MEFTSSKDIVEYLRQVNPQFRDLKTEMIDKPAAGSAETILLIFKYLLCEMTKCHPTHLSQMSLAALNRGGVHEYSEILEKGSQVFNCAIALDDVVGRITGSTDEANQITMLSLLNPTKRFIIRVFGICLRFIQFSKQHTVQLVEEFRVACTDTLSEKVQLEQASKILMAKIARFESEAEETNDQLEKLQTKSNELETLLHESKTNADAKKELGATLLSDLEQVDLTTASLDTELERFRSENRNLDYQVVTSPKKLVAEVERLKVTSEDNRKKLTEVNRKALLTLNRISTELPRTDDNLNSLSNALSDVGIAVEARSEIEENIKTVDQNIVKESSKISRLQSEQSQLQSRLQFAKEELQIRQSKLSAEDKQKMSECDDLRRQLNEVNKEIEFAQRDCILSKEEFEKCKTKCQNGADEYKSKLNKVLVVYRKITEKHKKQCSEFEECLYNMYGQINMFDERTRNATQLFEEIAKNE